MDLENLPISIPEEKFTRYALDPECQPDKAFAFKEALGFTKDNFQELIDIIRNSLDISTLKYKGTNNYGYLYESVIRLTGVNGKQANICIGWINDINKHELRLTSVYITDKKVKKDD